MTHAKNNLLKGIGIENFKAFSSYTYIPIERLSLFIGPNGSGKSSVWQVLQLLQNTLRIEPNYKERDEFHWPHKTHLSIEDYPELGFNPHALLWDKDKPLVIVLYSKVYPGRDIDMKQVIGYRFSLLPVKRKDITSFVLDSFELINEEELILFRYKDVSEVQEDEHSEGPPYEFEMDDVSMDNLGQFLLNIAHEISRMGELESFLGNDFTPEYNDQPEEFYDWDNHGCSLHYRSVKSRKHFGTFLEDSTLYKNHDEKIWPYGLHLLWSSFPKPKSDEEYLEYYKQTIAVKGHLEFLLKRVFNTLRITFEELLKQLPDISVLMRRTIGFSETSVDIESPTGKILKLFAEVQTEADKLDSSEYITGDSWELVDGKMVAKPREEYRSYYSLRQELYTRLGFDAVPVIDISAEHKNVKIEVGTVNLRNIGMGYWSMTFIIEFLFYCIVKRKKVVILEEPELNLHPSLQVELMDMIIDLVEQYNITVVLETHSEYMLRRLQLRVHEGGAEQDKGELVDLVRRMYKYNNFRSVEMSADKVVINSFEPLDEYGQARAFRCRPIRLDRLGFMDHPLPWTFSSVAANDALILSMWTNRGL